MAVFTFFYKVRVDLQKFSSSEGLMDQWNKEAQAATAAMDAGAVQIWKDAAEPVVYVVAQVEADDQAQAHGKYLQMLCALPMGADGQLIIEEGHAVIPYRDWAEYLAGR
jgi:hypothetical protein